MNLPKNCKNYVIYGKIAVNYKEKSFMEQAPGVDVKKGYKIFVGEI